jgi:translation initiation factor 2 subunit 1
MSLGREEWPEIGELVVATVQRVQGYGAYVSLDEYDNKEGLLHISEISSRWVRNIRNHVRQGQKVVLQVLRTDPSKEQVDLSLRRVSKDERRKKIESWKKMRKAETLLTGVAKSLEMDLQTLYDTEILKILDEYDSLYDGLEAAAKNGSKALTKTGVDKNISDVIAEVVKDKIIIKGVTIQGFFEVTHMGSSGVEEIKDVFTKSNDIAEENDSEIKVTTLGAPKYRIELTAEDYKKAETALKKVVDFTQEHWSRQDGTISFTRE